MSAQEVIEWMAYDRIEPFGQDRSDAQMAVVATTIANVNRPKGKKGYKVEDFMVVQGKKEPESLLDKAKRMNAALGGKVVVRKK